jgi:hypothetical protein
MPTSKLIEVFVNMNHDGFIFRYCVGSDTDSIIGFNAIDYLKTPAPFWKKEQTPSGARWVDARVSDDEAVAKWDPSH